MKSCLVSIVMLASLSTVGAQPFDTLLSQFNSIGELYPLADSTYILIGHDDHYRVERIDARANVLWSVELEYAKENTLKDFSILPTAVDTSIQLLFFDVGCNVTEIENYTSYTINSKGLLTDQQTWPADWGKPFLLSGQPGRPRIGIAGETYFILIDALGDTLQVLLTWPGGDTTNWDLIGPPRLMAICPNGDLVVGGSLFVFKLNSQAGTYKVYDTSGFYHGSRLLCIEDSAFIELNMHGLVRWSEGFPAETFNTDAYLYHYDIEWSDPDLVLRIDHLDEPDSIFLLDKHLTVKTAIEDTGLYGPEKLIITDSELFTIGQGNYYFDYGLLKSENRITHEGPRTDDIRLDDVVISPYDSVKLSGGPIFHYSIPQLTATITNNCEYTIQNAVIAYGGPYTVHCGDSLWMRDIHSMDLKPGQTKSFTVHDVFIRHYYASDYPECFYVLRPDNHKDDFEEDNTFCKEVALLSAHPDPFPIHHTTPVITDDLWFASPEKIDFTLRVFTLNGNAVFTANGNTYSYFQPDLDDLTPGMYILQYTIPATGQVYLEKMIKPN